MNFPDLISRATSGSLEKSELASVATALQGGGGDEYDCLLVLGRAHATEYRSLVEQYLHAENDPMMARLALQILCRYWRLAGEYADDIREFVQGVPWDEDDDVRVMAISCCSDLVAKVEYADLLRYLYGVVTNHEERKVIREAAYSAIVASTGTPAKDMASPATFDINSDVDESLMESVRKRLGGVPDQRN